MKKPEFSLVIAVAPGRNAEVLKSIKNINYPKNKFEVIVCPGPHNIPQSRNYGIKKSEGKIIGCIDDDAVVDSEILNKVEEFFKKYSNYEMVGGPQLTPEDDPIFARISGYALSSPLCTLRFSNRYGGEKLNLDANEFDLTTANIFIKRQIFDKIGGFDASMPIGEDIEFFGRAKLAGVKIAYSPEIKVFHRRRTTPMRLAYQNFRYGWAAIPRMQRARFNLSVLALFAGFILILISPILFLIKPWLALLGILYLAGTILASAWLAMKNKSLMAFFLLSYIIPLIHFSYGFGMLAYLFGFKSK